MQLFLAGFIQFIGSFFQMITIENYFLSLPLFFLVFRVLFSLVVSLFVPRSSRRLL